MLRQYARDYDFTLLFLTVALLGFGLLMVRSAAPPDPTYNFFQQQAMWAAVGIVAMMAVTLVDYRFLGLWSRVLYVGIVALLGAVFVLGTTSFGAQRWFQLLDRQLQPSEFAKLFLIIALARFLSDRLENKGAIIVSGALAAIPMVLVLLQPNLSTTIVLGMIWLTIALMAGMPLRWLLVGALLAGLAGWAAWPHMPAYQRDRVTIFLNPEADPQGQGYNLIQSRIAIGGGGLMGQGYEQGTQSQLGYLRVRHTDFIFSVIAEELGFVGALLLFGLLMALFFRLLRAMRLVDEPFGRLLIAGVLGWLFFQSYVNIGVNLRLAPPTGVPLPLISYGGSNLVTTLLALGLVQSVLIRQRKFEFGW